jgi:hypothetical protein
MTSRQPENDNMQELESITNYVDVLMDTFPMPISRKELAQKTGVSGAAITKMGSKLLRLCDKDTLIFDRKLVLKTDETFWNLLTSYFLKLKPTRVLLSKYGWSMIKRMNIHSKITTRVEEYSRYFNEEDTETIIRIILHNFENFQIANQIKINIGDSGQRMMLLSIHYATAVQGLLQKLDLPMGTNEDLVNIVRIRDKLFYLARDLIMKQVQKASILEEIPEEEKRTYLQVYSKTVDYYLRKIIGVATSFIRQVAEGRKLEFKKEFENIGNIL